MSADVSRSSQGQTHPYPPQRRGSTASSVHSVGGSLDTSASSWDNSVLETGQNGKCAALDAGLLVLTSRSSHLYSPTASHRSDRPPTAHVRPRVQHPPPADSQRHSPSRADQHSSRRRSRLQTVPLSGRRAVRPVKARQRERRRVRQQPIAPTEQA